MNKTRVTNFKEVTETLHQSLVDANLNDGQFNIIWSAINEAHSKLRIAGISKQSEQFSLQSDVKSFYCDLDKKFTECRYHFESSTGCHTCEHYKQ